MTRRVVLDVSSFQPGSIDWARIHRESGGEVVGGIVKATEGGWKFSNPYFESQVDGLHAAGMVAGSYSFEHPGQAGTADAQLFLQRIAGRKLELGIFEDCEVTDGVPPATLLARVLEDMAVLEAADPNKAGIYTGKWFWDPNTLGSVAAHVDRFPLWVAAYQAQFPLLPVPWTPAETMLWQFTDAYPTYFGGCDASVYLGNDAQWAAWTGQGVIPGPVVYTPGVAETRSLQGAVHATIDGIFGPDTDKRLVAIRSMSYGPARLVKPAVRYVQLVMAFGPAAADGIWGPITESHWTQTVMAIQRALGVTPDGVWGPATDKAFLAVDPLR